MGRGHDVSDLACPRDAPRPTRTPRKPRDRNASPAAPESILIVEDEPSVRILTRVVLERAGYRVLEAIKAAEALRVWDQHQGAFDLLLTDIVMPEGLNGRELATQLQARNPKLGVIFTSGYSADIAGRELTLREEENFIHKPSSPQQLLEIVRRCLDGQRGQGEAGKQKQGSAGGTGSPIHPCDSPGPRSGPSGW